MDPAEREHVRDLVRRVVELRDRLNELDSQIGGQIRDVEREFQILGIFTPVSVPMRQGQTLGWDKHGNKWRLVVRSRERRWESVQPLSDMSRETRALAMSFLPELLREAVPRLSGAAEHRAELGDFLDQVLLFLGSAPKP